MKVYESNALPSSMDDDTRQSVYNGMDSLLTIELFDKLYPQLKADTNVINYDFKRKCLGPVLTMVRRGIKIDPEMRPKVVEELTQRVLRLGGMTKVIKKGKAKWHVVNPDALLQRIAKVVWDKPFNYHSNPQLKEFFYDALSIPQITSVKKGERKVSTDEEALGKICERYVRGVPAASIILRLRHLEKQLGVLSTALSPTDRWAASYNLAGTSTGRWSSGDNPLWHSANVQNIDPAVRPAFVADEGYVLAYCDLQGAESKVVAYLSGDEGYIRAVESGDVHTIAAAMTWGFEPKREIAEQILLAPLTYRQAAKVLGHGSHYLGQPRTLGRQLSIPEKLIEDFQTKYFRAFPGIKVWQQHTITTLQRQGWLATPLGNRRQFWSRLTDEATWREAIAHKPQSLIGELMAAGIYKVWHLMDPEVQILANIHDALLCQLPLDRWKELLPKVLETLTVPVSIEDIHGNVRTLTIPLDAKVGYNWGSCSPTNPKGLGCLKL